MHPGTLNGEVTVGSPDLSNSELSEENKAGRIHVREPMTAQALKFPEHRRVMGFVDGRVQSLLQTLVVGLSSVIIRQ